VRMAEQLSRAIASVVASSRRIDSKPGAAREWLEAELDDIDLLVIVGGDGAVRQSAPLLADRKTLLWHAPAGTENLFARSFGMSGKADADADALIAAIQSARWRAIDLAFATPERFARPEQLATPEHIATPDARAAEAAGPAEPFLLMASCGFDAEVVHRLAERRRGAISHLSYVVPMLATLWQFRAPRFFVELYASPYVPNPLRRCFESAKWRGNVLIANSPCYAMRIDPARRARMNDGELDVVRLQGKGSLAALWSAMKCRVGAVPDKWTASGLRVFTDPPSRWQIDGDPAPWGRVASVLFTLRQQCVRVLLPAPTARSEAARLRQGFLACPAEDWILPSSNEEE